MFWENWLAGCAAFSLRPTTTFPEKGLGINYSSSDALRLTHSNVYWIEYILRA